MYVVMNELYVPIEGRDHVSKRFAESSGKMKHVPGCLDFMFLNPEDDSHHQIVLTKWESKADYENWINSDAFKQAHKKRRENLDKSPTSGNQIYAYEAVHHLSHS
ncbi:antibiotic biosynthesis monooxygenase [Salipaludibacillus sp. LMS25]|jgi:heme oxygenase (staphylobilin-producing)|uniref:antibiotic biosynthesis monooxygenase family protein n=1 Tax=Salipaludibacillus sp. LMS25 TaxID=2924031 RepID=UPI0020D01114|nr:antibiotic biosynthesis monooxygenase [Salipaludibacillus sp. LMS25]UTR14121.1 antibiotic biosynthesis monooxygenase [Salipaludibacillus sp. LMS25]